MSKKTKLAKNITLAAVSLISITSSTAFAIGGNEISAAKRMFGECSAYEKIKRAKLHSCDITNKECDYCDRKTENKNIRFKIIEVDGCTRQAVKITPTGDYDSSEKLSETDIKEFLLSKKEIFHRKYKTFVLNENEALTYADALIIDSRIALEDGFLSKNTNWSKLGDIPGRVMIDGYNIYTKNKFKDKFYETDFYEKEVEKSPSPAPTPVDPNVVLTYGGESMPRTHHLDEFIEKNNTSEYYNYEIVSVPNWTMRMLKITPKYSDSFEHPVDWESVKKYLTDNQTAFEYTQKLSHQPLSNPLEKLDAIIVHGLADDLEKDTQFIRRSVVYRKGKFFRLFLKPAKEEFMPVNLFKDFEAEEKKKSLAPSNSDTKLMTIIKKEILNGICFTISKSLASNHYFFSITPENFDSYKSRTCLEDIKKFLMKNKSLFGFQKTPEEFILTDYFDMVIFDEKILDYQELKTVSKNYIVARKPSNLCMLVRRDFMGYVPTDLFFEKFALAYNRDMDYIITNGQLDSWENTRYAMYPKSHKYSYLPRTCDVDTMEYLNDHFDFYLIVTRDEKISNEAIVVAEITPQTKRPGDKKALDINLFRDYIYTKVLHRLPNHRKFLSIDDFEYLDILLIDNDIRTNFSLPLKESMWTKFQKGLNCTIYVKRGLLRKITRDSWQYTLSYLRHM